MGSSDTNLSFDNISLQSRIATETDKNNDRYICTNSSRDHNSTPYPPLERGQNSDIHGTTGLPTRDPGEIPFPPPQQAWNRRESESCGSDEPEEEQNSNLSEALVTSLDCKEHRSKSRVADVDVELIEQTFFNLKFEQFENANDGHCTDSIAVSGQRSERKMNVTSDGWSSIESNLDVRAENGQQIQGEEHGDGGSMFKMPVQYPQYKDYNQRLNTFENWTKPRPHKGDLANAGLFYKGITKDTQGEVITDMVYCYKCGDSLMNFEDDDDPQKEHDRLYPQCRNTNWY